MLKQRINPTNLLLTFWLLLMCVSAQAAITVSVEANPDPVLSGESIYTAITVGNTGSSVSGPLTIQLRYPEHLSSLNNSLISDGGGCPGSFCSTTAFLTWTLGNLEPGASTTVTLQPFVQRSPDGSLITFDVEVFEDGSNVAMTSRSVVIQTASVFDIAIDEDLNPVAPNQSLTYTITYGNRSAENTTNTQLSFSLPSGVGFVSASGGGTLNSGVVEWDLQTFPANKGGRQTVTVDVNPGVTPGTLLDVDAATISGQTNFVNHAARAVATTRVENNVPLALSVELNPDPVQPGESLQGSLTVGNTSGSALSGVTLQLRYPEHLSSLNNSLISNGGGCPGNFCSTTAFLTWTLGNLAPGASITVTLPPFVQRSPDGSLITFDVDVFEDGGNVVMTSRSVVIQSASVFDIAIDEDLNPVAPNQSLTYTITYGNRSAESTTNTQLSFRLPSGVSFVSASGGGTLNSGVVEWDLQTFPANKGGRQTVTVDVNPGVTSGTLLDVDAATISGQTNSINHAAHAVATTRVENNMPLALSVKLNPDPAQPNESLQSALTVGNTSGSALFGITLQLRYPEHLSSLNNSLISDGGGCPGSFCSTTAFLTWTLGNLAPGASITVTLPPFVQRSPDGSLITFDVEVFEDGGNVAMTSRSVVIQSASVFDIAIDEDLNPVAPNQSLTYTITYGNRSAESTTNTQLSFPLPSGVSFVSASGGGTLNSGVVEWDLQTFPANKGGRQTVTVDVNPGVTSGTLLDVDAATISGQTNSINHTAHAVATTRVEDNVPLALSVELNPDPVQLGESLQGALTVGNTSGSTLFGVTLQLRYPEHLSSLNNSLISDGGGCPGNFCSTTAFLTWTLGNFAPGASTTVTLPPIVQRSPDGTLISFLAIVKEDNGRRARKSSTALVSEFDFVSPPQVTPPSALISDVDGNGQSDALTDGLLIIRFLFGLSGSALTEGAIGAGSSMNSTQIIAFLTTNSAAMDVDGNGSSDALTDGLLIIRYLFGIRGSALISGAIGPGATRSTIIDVENFLQDF